MGSSDYKGSGYVKVADAAGADGDALTITELLSGEKYERSAQQMRDEGLFVVVEPWFGQIFSY